MLEARDLYCERDERTLFRGLSFTVDAGEWVQVTGGNGAGKTTLLRLLTGLARPDGGEVYWQGEPSLSALLKQYGIRLTANQAYHQMVKLGIVEQRERYSRTGINNIKKFWSLTAKGCMFGKNITSPANPRETQPHFFESRFPELLKLLDTVH
nr:ATP-binding cassette domain-containing protein [Salmonella enterica]